MERIAKASPLGIEDPDARALALAYVQAIDHGKHGAPVQLSAELRARVGMR
jgi:hypothetical protein